MTKPLRSKDGKFVKKNGAAPVKDDSIVNNPMFREPNDLDEMRNKTKLEIGIDQVMNEPKPLGLEMMTKLPSDIGIEGYQDKKDTLNLKCYHLYHVVDDEQIGKENEGRVERKYIGTFYATDIVCAALKCNHRDVDYHQFGKIRDTMIGDVLCDELGFYMICETGFKLIAILTDHE